MYRRMLFGAALFALGTAARGADTWLLVTPEEVARDRAHPDTAPGTPLSPSTRSLSRPSGPTIVVEQPDETKPLHTPLSFRVRFVAAPGAAVDPHSFRATYGSLGLDITSRLLSHAQLSGDELSADNVDIPAGTHIVTIVIADQAGHETSRTFQFTVA
jgi:hypothetical protein